MSAREQRSEEYGPLGPGAAPVKDPLKGLTGVISGTLIMEALTIFLALTVVLQIDSGSYWTPFNWGFIVFLGFAHVIVAFVQRWKYGLQVALGLQVVGFVGSLWVHWSLCAIILIFAVVWYYVISLRKTLIERMKRGLLVTQHLGTGDSAAEK